MVESPGPLAMIFLAIQYGIFRVADMFTLVGLLDFFYSESSVGMKSSGTSFTWFSSSIGYLNRDKLNYFFSSLKQSKNINFVRQDL